jgi:hypothetical protein
VKFILNYESRKTGKRKCGIFCRDIFEIPVFLLSLLFFGFGQSAFRQLRQRPIIFRRELVNDILRFQSRWQHFPSVSFHFQVRAEFWVFRERIQNAEQMVVRIFKRRRGGRVQLNVKMNPPFGKF